MRPALFGMPAPTARSRDGREGRRRAPAAVTGLAIVGLLAALAPASAGAAAGTLRVTASAASAVETLVYGTSYAPASGTPGGTLVIGETTYPRNLNPYYSMYVSDAEASAPILRGCAAFTSDGKYVPDLCASLPSEDNGGIVVGGATFTMTLHLKPGLTWSDGHPLTMQDLKYTWQWANDPGQVDCWACGPGSTWQVIDSIEVSADGLTATVHFAHLTSGWGGWLGWLTSAFLPEHYMSTIPVADAAKSSYPVGPEAITAPVSGPFRVAAVTVDEITYARNPTYKGGVSPTHIGPAYLESLKFRFFGDAASEIAAFQEGSIDLALGLPLGSYADLKETPDTVGRVEQAPSASYEQLIVNNDPRHARRNGLWDLNVRKAIATAINKPAIVKALFPGESVRIACTPFIPTAWFAKPESCPAYSPKAAQALLTKAGWKVDKRGWVADRSGRQMNLQLCTTENNPTRLATLEAIQANLKAIHVKSSIVTVPASVLFSGWASSTPSTRCSKARGTFDLALFTYGLGTSPTGAFSMFQSSKWPELGDHSGQNDARFKSPAMDKAVKALETDVTLASQVADAHAALDAYVAGIPQIALYYRNAVTTVGVHVGNWAGYNPSSVHTWNVEDWYYRP